jgi:hypothetical protein
MVVIRTFFISVLRGRFAHAENADDEPSVPNIFLTIYSERNREALAVA